MIFLEKLQRKFSLKWRITLYLLVLLIFSGAFLKLPERILYGVLIVAIYAGFDLLWTRFRDGMWYTPVSSLISGLVLALVAIPSPPWWFLFLAPFLAVCSKQLLKWPRKRHIFNPASFAMLAISFFSPAVSWWGVAWGEIPLVIVLLVGCVILYQFKRFPAALSFVLSYAIFLGMLFLLNETPIKDLGKILMPQIIDGTTLFFATVMLVEPITSQFPTVSKRVFYGASVGFFAVAVTFFASIAPSSFTQIMANLDPLITGLLLGNLLSYILFIVRQHKPKQLLTS